MRYPVSVKPITRTRLLPFSMRKESKSRQHRDLFPRPKREYCKPGVLPKHLRAQKA